MRITVVDRQSFRVDSQRVMLDNGYMAVPARVARCGIQQYTAEELGLTDRPPHQLVNVYRPPEEVFKPESLASWDNKDITVQHPKEFVNSRNYRDVSVGHTTSPGRKDGDYVVVDMLIKAQDAIDAVNDGTAEVSGGYSAEYLPKQGTAPDGTPYEFIQTDIEINHSAICDNARAGRFARLFDSKPKEKPMSRVTLDSGKSVEVADDATATLIQTTIDSLVKKVADGERAVNKLQTDNATLEVENEQKDEEIEKLKKETGDAAIAARVDAVVATMAGARTIAGKTFSCDSMDPMVIKRQALKDAAIQCKKYGTWDKAPDVYVTAWFDAEEERKEQEDEEECNQKKESEDSLDNFSKDLNNSVKKGTTDATQLRAKARQAFLDQRYGKTEGAK